MIPESETLLEIVVAATRRAAAVVRDTLSSSTYAESTRGRRYTGVEDHHYVPMLDDAAETVIGKIIFDRIGDFCGKRIKIANGNKRNACSPGSHGNLFYNRGCFNARHHIMR